MNRILVTMRDGTVRTFEHRPRAGGSWTLTSRYEPGFFVVIDEWRNETAIPTADIAEIRSEPERGGW